LKNIMTVPPGAPDTLLPSERGGFPAKTVHPTLASEEGKNAAG
jgi:hypothetical protein